MTRPIHLLFELLAWLSANGAAHATVILVFITGIYAVLTWRMTRAISLQTQALIRPAVALSINWAGKEFAPEGYFSIENVGAAPLLVLDVLMTCNHGTMHLHEHFTLWDQHVIAPKDSLSPCFDFKRGINEAKLPLHEQSFGYSLEVVVSDLAKQVTLTYVQIPVLAITNVHSGMPLTVAIRYRRRWLKWRISQLKRLIKWRVR